LAAAEQKTAGFSGMVSFLMTRRAFGAGAAMLLAGGMAGLPAPAFAQVTAFRQAVAEFASDDEALAAFYRDRDYSPIWIGEADLPRRQALVAALAGAAAHGLPVARYDLDGLLRQFGAATTARDLGRVEVAASRVLLSYAQAVQSGALEPRPAGGAARLRRRLARGRPAPAAAADRGIRATDEGEAAPRRPRRPRRLG
jgi:murein L,D-transpeptidase YcbB/YkuD